MKTFSLKDVYEKEPCEGEWIDFHYYCSQLKKLRWDEKLTAFQVEEIKTNHSTWYKWLLEKGLVEEDKKVPKIRVGMRVPKGILNGYPQQEYIIAQPAAGWIQLIGLKDGNRWQLGTKACHNVTDITLDAFNQILRNCAKDIEEIANKLIPPKED